MGRFLASARRGHSYRSAPAGEGARSPRPGHPGGGRGGAIGVYTKLGSDHTIAAAEVKGLPNLLLPGYAKFKPDSILNKTTAFEINPGVSLGIQYKFSKKWGMEMQAGPKLIIANGEKHFTNTFTRQNFETTFNNIKAGYMFTGSFYFQF